MTIIDWFKETLDWGQRLWFFVKLFISLGGGTLVMFMLRRFIHLDPVLIVAIGFFSAAACLVAVIWASKRFQPQLQQQNQQKDAQETTRSWLDNLAKVDAYHMPERFHFIWAAVEVMKHLDASDPYLELLVPFVNSSVFSVTIEGINGNVYFRQHPLQRGPEIVKVMPSIDHGTFNFITVRQWISPHTVKEINDVKEAQNVTVTLDTDRLIASLAFVNDAGESRRFVIPFRAQITI